jgi:phage terminase large subunit
MSVYKPDIDMSNVLNKTVLPVYREKFRSEARYDVYKGGAGSGKSRFVAQKILYRIIYQKGHRYLVIRKVKDTMKASVFQLFKDYIYSWGVESKFHITESPMKIVHKATQNGILFMGVDNPEKLKSIEKITSVWIEEASELDEKDFNELDRRLRGNLPHYKQIHISFNPISHLHWLKTRFFDNPPKNLDIIETTFLDNPKLPEEDREVLRDMERYDYQQYRIYALNEWGVLNNNIIHHRYDYKVHISDKTVDDFVTLHIGLDFNIGGSVGVVLGEDNKGIAHIVDEFVVYDTEMIIQELQNRYFNHDLILYPDVSGGNRSTNSTVTDIDMLKQAGYYCNVPTENGATATRYNACNRKLMSNTLLVNPITAQKTNESLQVHAYDERGQPEKFTNHKGGAQDDFTDAFGYVVGRLYPVVVSTFDIKMSGI